jgi:hypothetical protein
MSIRRIALTSAALTLAFTTLAQARADTRTMTCQQTQALIQSNGSAVLTTGPSTYALYIRQYSNACEGSEIPAGGVCAGARWPVLGSSMQRAALHSSRLTVLSRRSRSSVVDLSGAALDRSDLAPIRLDDKTRIGALDAEDRFILGFHGSGRPAFIA